MKNTYNTYLQVNSYNRIPMHYQEHFVVQNICTVQRVQCVSTTHTHTLQVYKYIHTYVYTVDGYTWVQLWHTAPCLSVQLLTSINDFDVRANVPNISTQGKTRKLVVSLLIVSLCVCVVCVCVCVCVWCVWCVWCVCVCV